MNTHAKDKFADKDKDKKPRKGKGEAGREVKRSSTDSSDEAGAKSAELAMIERVIKIRRVTKVTKGGKNMNFTALVVVGDGKGKAGYALGKAPEVSEAIRKAMGQARKRMVSLPVNGVTIPHDIVGEFSSHKVLLKPASLGTGIIACFAVRAICEAAGIHDILTKVLSKSSTPLNIIKATFDGFQNIKQ
jgi:small subunit ribosomal protein S5